MLTFHLLQQTGLVKDMRLDEVKLKNFLQKIEAGYDPANPYHNRYGVRNPIETLPLALCVALFALALDLRLVG